MSLRLPRLCIALALGAWAGCSGRSLSAPPAMTDAGGGPGTPPDLGASGNPGEAAGAGQAAGAAGQAAGAAGQASGPEGAAAQAGAAGQGGAPSAALGSSGTGTGGQASPIMACDVGCPSGPCPTRIGTTSVVATGPSTDHIAAIAVGPDVLYYGTAARDVRRGGQLHKVTLSTGVDSLLVDGVQIAQVQLGPGGTVDYVVEVGYSSEERLFSLAAAGPPMLLADNDYPIVGFTGYPDDLALAVASPGGGSISETDEVIQDLTETPNGLAVDRSDIYDAVFYWTSGSGPGHLTRMTNREASVGGAVGTVLVTADDALGGPILDGPNLYFVHQHAAGDCQGSVVVIPSSGGTPSVVSLGNSGSDVSSFAVDHDDAGAVYWTTPDAGGLVFRAAKGGGTPEVIASSQSRPAAVGVDATRAYWVAAGLQGDEVRAVAK